MKIYSPKCNFCCQVRQKGPNIDDCEGCMIWLVDRPIYTGYKDVQFCFFQGSAGLMCIQKASLAAAEVVA